VKRYWVIAPCDSTKKEVFEKAWEYDLQNGTIAVGWKELGDVSKLDRSELEAKYRDAHPEAARNIVSLEVNELWAFFHEVSPGDVVIARRGIKKIAGIGTVIGTAYHDDNKGKERVDHLTEHYYPNFVNVRWERKEIKLSQVVFSQVTINEILEDKYRSLLESPPEEEEALRVESEPKTHWEAIFYIVKAGNLLGYDTYVADPSKSAFGKKLGEIAKLSEVPSILRSAPEISRVDVIWYKPVPPYFFFEVEEAGTMRDALHRLYNAMAFDARFFVVSPVENRVKFEKWLATAPYKEYEERYNFHTYSELFDFYRVVAKFSSMRERFLKL